MDERETLEREIARVRDLTRPIRPHSPAWRQGTKAMREAIQRGEVALREEAGDPAGALAALRGFREPFAADPVGIDTRKPSTAPTLRRISADEAKAKGSL